MYQRLLIDSSLGCLASRLIRFDKYFCGAVCPPTNGVARLQGAPGLRFHPDTRCPTPGPRRHSCWVWKRGGRSNGLGGRGYVGAAFTIKRSKIQHGRSSTETNVSQLAWRIC